MSFRVGARVWRVDGASTTVCSLDALGYLMRSSLTMGEAIRRMERYARLVNEAAIQRFETHGTAVVLIDGPRHGPPWPALYCDQVAAAYFALTSKWTGPDLRGIRIELPHSAPDCDPALYYDTFGDGVELDAPRLAVHLPDGFVDQPFVTAERDRVAAEQLGRDVRCSCRLSYFAMLLVPLQSHYS